MATLVNQTVSGAALVVRTVDREPITDVTKHSFIPTSVTFPAGGATYVFDFAQQQQNKLFDHPESMFVDNSSNPSPIMVAVSITGQTFPVPAYSSGNFRLLAVRGSQVTLSSQGAATGNVSIIFADFELDLVDYSAFNQTGANPRTVILGNDGTSAQGPSNPITVGGATTGGQGVAIQVDATGRVAVFGAAAGGSVYGNDATGNAPGQPPVYTAGLDTGGKVRPFLTNPLGHQLVSGPTAVGAAPAAGVNPQLIGGLGTDGFLHTLAVDNTGQLRTTYSLTGGAALAAGGAGIVNGGYDSTGFFRLLSVDTIGRQNCNNYANVVAANANPAYATGGVQLLTMTPSGRLRVDDESQIANAALTNVAQSNVANGVALLAANPLRRGFVAVNDTTANMFVAYAATSSATGYTYKVPAGATLELLARPYTGAITVWWDAAGAGAARVTELS